MSSEPIDTNVDNYSINDLMTILKLNDDLSQLEQKSNAYIQKFQKNGNKTMETFFRDIQRKLVAYVSGSSNYSKDFNQTDNWIHNEVLKQNDKTQTSKITERKDKIDVYENDHVPMNREQLGLTNTFDVPVAQDSLNPNLKNTTERFINLDSQFRQPATVSTDYSLDLSDHLSNVLSLRLFSFQIPVTWYVIDETYGNTCFWIQDGDTTVPITIASGNYTPTNFVSALNTAIISAGFTTASLTPFVSYNTINAKITLALNTAVYTGGGTTFTVSANTLLIFYDYTSKLQCQTFCVNRSFYINNTLGWIMGFRLPYENSVSTGNVGAAVLDLNGPRYLILAIDDFNQNHLNNGLVTITELSKTLKMPNYYSPDLPYFCVSSNVYSGNNLQANINTVSQTNVNSGELLFDKLNVSYSGFPQVLPSAPRTLTQSQIYTINEIIKNNDKTTNYYAKAPTTSDVFALIPIKGGQTLGELYVEFSGSLQDFKRIYFGPVDIDRLHITLMDDKGNVLNLNGSDWSIILICENLYQY
jgi:hypothetical protein